MCVYFNTGIQWSSTLSCLSAPTFSHPRSYSQGENYRNHVVMLGCPMGAWSSLPFVQTFRNLRPAGLWGENSCGIMGRKFLRQSPIPCENSGFSVLRVGPTRQQTEESVKGYMWNYSSTCLFWSPTDATVAIIMHCSHGQKNYGNMSIEKLSPLSGNK